MVITRETDKDIQVSQTTTIASKIKTSAKMNLLVYKYKTSDQELDIWLQTNQKTNLRTCCNKLITSATISVLQPSTIKIYWIDKELNDLALLITNGNTQVYGSDILKEIF